MYSSNFKTFEEFQRYFENIQLINTKFMVIDCLWFLFFSNDFSALAQKKTTKGFERR